jgi:hypothetical protein
MKKQRLIVPGLLVLLLLVMVTTAAAKAPSASAILWRVFSGGAPASSGNITLNGSLGQTAIGSAAAGKARIGSGYWYAMQPYAILLPMIVR